MDAMRDDAFSARANSGAAVQTFRSELRGAVLGPGDAGYDEGRKVYKAMIDKQPAVIARCVDVGEVIRALALGRRRRAFATSFRAAGRWCGGWRGSSRVGR